MVLAVKVPKMSPPDVFFFHRVKGLFQLFAPDLNNLQKQSAAPLGSWHDDTQTLGQLKS